MKEEYTPIDDLIITYLSDGLEPRQLEELKEWMNASPEHHNYFMDQQELWFSALGAKEEVYNKDSAFEQFKYRINKKQPTVRKGYFNRSVYQVAAVALLLIVSFASYRQGKQQVKSSFSDMVIEAPLGSRTKLFLPDGSLVWLNAGSAITYSQGFGVSDRHLTLSGEAYFEVVKKEELPFSVTTTELSVKVLGTRFNLKNYSDDDEVIVNLMEGRVSVDNFLMKNSTDRLLPNEKVVLNKKTGIMVKSGAGVIHVNQWTQDILFFDEELLSDIIKKLERAYDVRIEVTNPLLLKERFYGEFRLRKQTVQEVLDMLASTGRLQYKYEEDTIVLY